MVKAEFFFIACGKKKRIRSNTWRCEIERKVAGGVVSLHAFLITFSTIMTLRVITQRNYDNKTRTSLHLATIILSI